MTEQEEQWFDALAKDRSENASTLEKPSMRGIQRSVVDKYSDQAHFIYELLQNADDVNASVAHFRLVDEGLVFTHNGTVRFTVSDPENEDSDTLNGTLGHINAITSIANSSKTESSIGKFGVGFKAVFQYTQTPHVYDPKIKFKIERFIVPSMLNADLQGRNPSETAFFFPFDHETKSPRESYDEILEKIKALESPVLFLSHLQTVAFEADEVSGEYTKEITRTLERGDITVQWLELALQLNDKRTTRRLLVFRRKHSGEHPYFIGCALGDDGQLMPLDRPAFCFFPTKEATNLNFILHAPFLLTDSREGIKAGEPHNQELIQLLAQLAADSLPILRDENLIDDGILEVLPYNEKRFSELDDRRKISFKPFFFAIKDKLQIESLLPAANGKCSSKSVSYWASDTELVELFSDKQLALLTGVKDAQWVFRSRGKKEVQNSNSVLADYIDGGDARKWMRKEPNLIASSLAPDDVLRRLNSDFIAAQSLSWLHEFYGYLSERASYQQYVKHKPIFLDQDGMPAPAFDSYDQLVLFLPDDDIDGYTTVKKELLSRTATREFIEKLGVKRPSLRDEIYNKILPTYETGDEIDTSPHFVKFFRYFRECRNDEVTEFIGLIKDKEFLEYRAANDETVYRGQASDIYLPTDDLLAWFEPTPTTRFLLLDKYRTRVSKNEHDSLDDFFRELGILQFPKVVDVGSVKWNFKDISDNDKKIDGLEELLTVISATTSKVIWNTLAGSWSEYEKCMQVRRRHFGPRGGNKGSDYYNSSANTDLRTRKWILNRDGELVSADVATIQSLSDQYDSTSAGAETLITFLRIRDDAQDTSHLSEDEARKIKLADEIERSGLTEDEVLAAIEDAICKKTVRPSTDKCDDNSGQKSSGSDLMQDIEKRRPSVKNANPSGENKKTSPEPVPRTDTNEDSDDYTPKAVDYGKKLDRAKDRYASELDRIAREQALHDKASSLPRYSYGWILALLELECMASSEKNADNKTISISFGRVERESQSSRTIVLKEPSRFIPQSIEEFSGVRVDLDFGNSRTGKLRVESFTAKEFSLFGKLESAGELDGIDLGEVLEARIEVQNPSFLLQELLERFRELRLDESFNMKANLTPDIEFVFGPPGTGKTTHLAENLLIPRMSDTQKTRILVLTPTNKAADVLTTRIMEAMEGDTAYLNWLVRFGTSADEAIEKAGVWRDRSFDIGGLNRSVTVTTIARFAYDGFVGERGKKLHEMKWDVIVFDEASMISLASIIYPLYRQKPQKFIIAGDPFQIEPIVAVEQWKDESIYSLVGLNKDGSFAKPATEPHNYPVTNLEVQYRSISAIGDIVSRFTYDGVLKHHRAAGTQRPLKLNGVDAKPITLIRFPVSKYESIYRPKRLNSGTPYQTYSALFTFELVRWLAEQIQEDSAVKIRIGVIAPYRAQANVLSRLNDSWATRPDAVEIQVGTIHGFQGDECDIIIAVLNPPPVISRSPQMFLNKQNILNVAISRARDYLFLVMPDDETEGVENLHKVAKIEKLVKSSGAFSEYASRVVEEMIWGNGSYLEDNTFATGHQMVNVYRKPERYYEVRSDDSAIDVQVHEKHRDGLG